MRKAIPEEGIDQWEFCRICHTKRGAIIISIKIHRDDLRCVLYNCYVFCFLKCLLILTSKIKWRSLKHSQTLSHNFSQGNWFCCLFASQYRYQQLHTRGISDITWHVAPNWRYSGDFRTLSFFFREFVWVHSTRMRCTSSSSPPNSWNFSGLATVYPSWLWKVWRVRFPSVIWRFHKNLCDMKIQSVKRLLKHGLFTSPIYFFIFAFWLFLEYEKTSTGLGSCFPGRLLRGILGDRGWDCGGMDSGQTLTSGKHVPNLSVFEGVLVFETGLFSQINSISHKIEVGMTEID